MEIATFGAGCFWGVQLGLSKMKGVKKTTAGYMGGDEKKYPNPTYEQTCTGKTGYAEVVQVEFDSKLISYGKLLDFFWNNHNPTTMNRQGPDVGTQYRSVIFYYNKEQEKMAIISREKAQKKFDRPIVTEIVPAKTFFPAEEYHQDYLKKHGQEYCHI